MIENGLAGLEMGVIFVHLGKGKQRAGNSGNIGKVKQWARRHTYIL